MRLAKGKIKRSVFAKRLNRFVVECVLEGKRINAYLPNPGRLWELLLPGKPLLIRDNDLSARNNPSKAKLPFTVIATEREGIPILLHTHLANHLTEWIIREKLIQGFEDYRILKREVKLGSNRYDFLLEKESQKMFFEVKNCTLFSNPLAMFPDAITARGRKHLLGLHDLAMRGSDAAVLFVVQWPYAQYFMPDYHTDLEFARTLLKVKEKILVKAIAVQLHKDFTIERRIKELRIPWDRIEKEAIDRGSYIIILHLGHDASIEVGGLGMLLFKKGYYLYVGSAERGLTKRMERHRRKIKKTFWHIDYLTSAAHFCKALPIRSSLDLECELASKLSHLSDWQIPLFGCSDCGCESHLFGMKQDPIQSSGFINLIMNYRIRKLGKMIGPNTRKQKNEEPNCK